LTRDRNYLRLLTLNHLATIKRAEIFAQLENIRLLRGLKKHPWRFITGTRRSHMIKLATIIYLEKIRDVFSPITGVYFALLSFITARRFRSAQLDKLLMSQCEPWLNEAV
jgi:hypothetical protein